MAKDFCAVGIPCEECHLYKNRCHAKKYATRAYNNGYRKTSDIAREVTAEFKELVKQHLFSFGIYPVFVKNAMEYAESKLKKKYIGKDTNVTTNTEEGK